jgi:hypothetical protein
MPSSLRIHLFAVIAALFKKSPMAVSHALLACSLLAVACNRSKEQQEADSRPATEAAARTARPITDSPAGKGAADGKPARGSLLGTDSAAGIQPLLDTVTARLLRGDTVGLVRLMLDDSAWRRNIYPSTAGYDSTSEDAFHFLLGMHKANSAKALRRVLAEVRKPDSTPAVILRALDSTPAPGGILYDVRPGDGVRPFGSSFCSNGTCKVATFGQPGASRRKD